MEKYKRLSDFTTYDLIKEIRERSDVVGMIVWLEEDIKCALQDNSYIPTEKRVDEVINKLSLGQLEDCSRGWDVINDAIEFCEFGEPDLEE